MEFCNINFNIFNKEQLFERQQDEIKCIAKNGEKFLAHTLEYIETNNQSINENGDQDKES